MSKVIIRAGKVVVSILLPFIVVCIVLYSAFANNGATSVPQETAVVASDALEPAQTDVLSREEIANLRDDHTRGWQVTKLVDKYNPKTGKNEKVEQVSRIIEKGSGICYLDDASQWQVADTAWVMVLS